MSLNPARGALRPNFCHNLAREFGVFMDERRSRILLRLTPALLGLLSLACVDAGGEYDSFNERAKKTSGPGGTGCGDPTAACQPATPADLEGQWLFALSATINPVQPILFFADIVSQQSGSDLTWAWTITPLSAADKTPLSALPPLEATTVPADGAWSADLPPLAVPGAANPITGSDIEADTTLTGNVCGSRNFLCGDVGGMVTKPIQLGLEGSTWTLARLEEPNKVPDVIFINCQCGCAEGACPAGDAGAGDGGVSDASPD